MDRLYQSNLYDDIDLNTLDYISEHFTKCKLLENCRNPKRIIEETNKITGTSIKNRIKGESPAPEYTFIDNDSKEEHARRLQEILDHLAQEQIPLSDICILTQKDAENSCVNNLDSDTQKLVGNFRSPILKNSFVRFYDILSFKGQEAEFIISIDWYSDQPDKNLKNIFYSMLTRSKHSVYVVTSNKEQYLKTMVGNA